MPKLYGVPTYTRPGLAYAPKTERPLDLDDLPLEAARAQDDQALEQLTAHSYEASVDAGRQASSAYTSGGEGSPILRGRPFRLRLPGRKDGGQG